MDESRLVAEPRAAAFELAGAGLVVTDSAGSILRANRVYANLLGITLEDLPGTAFVEAFPAEERPAALRTFKGALVRDALPMPSQWHLQRRDGSLVKVLLTIQPTEMSSGRLGAVLTIIDISVLTSTEARLIAVMEEQRLAHAALEGIRADLEQRVIERTRDLENKNIELQTQIAERREIEERLRSHNDKLVFNRNQLLALAERNAVDFPTALHGIASVAMRTLGLDRLSFWRLYAENDRLNCEFSLRADGEQDPPEAHLHLTASTQLSRFSSVRGHDIVNASSADPRTAGLVQAYMLPLGLSSMLEMPVWLEGRVVGKLGFEAMGTAREWSPEDIDFAAGICTLVALAQEAEQRQLAEAKLRRLAHFDALTGLPNRHLLLDRLKQALAFAQRHRGRVALMFLDLDRFKTINDSLGHLVGDKLLIEVARRLTGSLRMEDSVARIGGDEFVVVLQDVRNIPDTAVVAQNLLAAIEPPYSIDGRDLHVSGSIGIALYPEDGSDIETLMRNADTAMYHVKEIGRNGFKFFTASMNAQASARLNLENDLRVALRRNELVLHYQPQYEIASGRICAIEALLRWQHPDQGLIHPDAFIPLAEESGLIQTIGEWTLTQACAQIEAWHQGGMPPIPVAINLSARQFRNPNFAQVLEVVLAASHLPPSMVELEITESALMQDSEATLETLRRLKAMGIRLAIDDFGIGYSSLAYLKRFPIDKLKIDRSFIRDIPEDADDVAISGAIISMAKELGVRVVAEGVETAAQMDFLRARGCEEAQGFLLCPPLNAQELHARLAGIPPALLRR